MKKLILLLVSLTLFISSCSKEKDTDNTEITNIEFSSQDEINSFNFTKNNQITTINISGSDITDLSALNSLNSLDKLIIDKNPKLINLNGLENLLSITGSLQITNNRSLGNFKAIKNLNFNNLSDEKFIIEGNLFNPKKASLNAKYRLGEKTYTPVDICINTQSEFDNFIREKYTEVNGNLCITSSVITSLIGLESLNTIEGELTISDTNLKSLKGLENLTSVNGIRIQNNNQLINIDGLDNVKSIGSEDVFAGFSFYKNNNLLTLEGLDKLSYLSGTITIIENKKLSYINCFNNITTLGISYYYLINPINLTSKLHIESNPNLLSFETSFDSLQEIFGNLFIENNQSLKSLKGLESLERVLENINIKANNSLTNMIGLNNLYNAGRNTYIENNQNLKNLNGLENANFSQFYIINNPSLETLTTFKFKNMSRLEIRNNASLINLKGLEQLEEIILGAGIIIKGNIGLISLDGLEGLNRSSLFAVRDNINLTDYCALNETFKKSAQFIDNLDPAFNNGTISGNAYNPTYRELIILGKCKL